MAGAGSARTYIDAAVVHIAAGEYDDARQDLLAAEVALIAEPDTSIATWARQAIANAWSHLNRMTAESSPFRPRRMLYDRP